MNEFFPVRKFLVLKTLEEERLMGGIIER